MADWSVAHTHTKIACVHSMAAHALAIDRYSYISTSIAVRGSTIRRFFCCFFFCCVFLYFSIAIFLGTHVYMPIGECDGESNRASERVSVKLIKLPLINIGRRRISCFIFTKYDFEFWCDVRDARIRLVACFYVIYNNIKPTAPIISTNVEPHCDGAHCRIDCPIVGMWNEIVEK